MQSSAPNISMASLYVGNLHPDMTEAMLYDLFSPIGTLHSIRVCRNRITRRSLRYAYVNFQQPAHAKHALDTMSYDTVMGRQLRIMWSQRDRTLRDNGIGNIFLKGLEKSIDSQALYDTFSAFGNILSCKVESDENGSKGYGFVHFEAPEDAERAIKRMNGMLLNDEKVFVGPFKSSKERGAELRVRTKAFTGINLYIKNLEEEIDDMQLRKEFSPFGNIISAKVMMERGRSKGFGFVSLSSAEEATKAIAAMNGRILATKPLYVALVRPKEHRRAYLANRSMQRKAVMRAMPNTEINLPALPSGSSMAAISRASIQCVSAQTTGLRPTSAPAAPVHPGIHLLSEESQTTSTLAAIPLQQRKQMLEYNMHSWTSQHKTISGYQKKTPPLMASPTIEDEVNDLALQLEAKLSPPCLRESGRKGFWPCDAPEPTPLFGLALEAEGKPLRMEDGQTGLSCSYIRAPLSAHKLAPPLIASPTIEDDVNGLALQLEAKLILSSPLLRGQAGANPTVRAPADTIGAIKPAPPVMASPTIEDEVNDLAQQLETKLSPPRLRESGKTGFWPCVSPASTPTMGLALKAEDKPLTKERQTGLSCSSKRALKGSGRLAHEQEWDLKDINFHLNPALVSLSFTIQLGATAPSAEKELI